MGLESVSYLSDLNASNPVGASDPKSAGDDHIRNIKTALLATFPGLGGRVERVQGKTASYDLVAADNLTLIAYTGGTTPTLGTAVAASTLGNGFRVSVINVSGSLVSFNPNGSETVNGVEDLDIPDDYTAFIWCDGSNFYAMIAPIGGPSETTPEPTGTVKGYVGTTAPSGYVLASGLTIGNASSGGTERANADTEALFTLLWGSFANAELPIQDSAGAASSRGASAASDFAANKRLPVPDLRGRVWVTKDNLGGSAASRVTSGGSGLAGATMGAVGGDQLSQSHTHTADSHSHTFATAGNASPVAGFGSTPVTTTTAGGQSTSTAAVTIQASGSGASQNVQPSFVGTTIIKL